MCPQLTSACGNTRSISDDNNTNTNTNTNTHHDVDEVKRKERTDHAILHSDAAAVDTRRRYDRYRFVRKRPVSFGVSDNRGGNVYTMPYYSNDDDNYEDDIDDDECIMNRLVAIIGVPPEHVPEGILNLIRSHRPYIEHVRVVISTDDKEEDDDDNDNDDNGSRNNRNHEASTNYCYYFDDEIEGGIISKTNEEDDENKDKDQNITEGTITEESAIIEKQTEEEHHQKVSKNRKYIVLVQLSKQEHVFEFIDDLNGKPYIAFDDQDTCQIERVLRLETTQQIKDTAALQIIHKTILQTKLFGELENEHQQRMQSKLRNKKDEVEKQQSEEAKIKTTNNSISTASTDRTSSKMIISSLLFNYPSDRNSTCKIVPTMKPTTKSSSSGSPKNDGSEKEEKKEKESATNHNNNNMDDDTNVQNCAVCLEDLGLSQQRQQYVVDESSSSTVTAGKETRTKVKVLFSTTANHQQDRRATVQPLLTTVCNHTFHLDCLSQCTGPCPVCRYDHAGLNETLSQCHLCGTTENNYVCLICGVVSCNNYYDISHHNTNNGTASSSSGNADYTTTTHAGQHYRETLHAYALDTETQHVYDFVGQGWVHRLAQSKDDGKLVELTDIHAVTTSAAIAPHSAYGRSLTPGLSDVQEGEVVHRKLEGAAEQYNTLLKSQLEQQRAYYEKRIRDMKNELYHTINPKETKKDEQNAARDLITILKQERKHLANRLSTIQKRTKKAQDNNTFLTSMNESLVSNKTALKLKIQQAARERNDSADMLSNYLPSLEKNVSSLMMQLTGEFESMTTTTDGAIATATEEVEVKAKKPAVTTRKTK